VSGAGWDRIVRVRRGQRVLIDVGRGVQLTCVREESGAVELRNEVSGSILRQWSPKEARTP
jgi:hypothetical protein